MTFRKGDPKPEGSGRKKGQPNRSSLRLIDDLEEAGVNLVAEYVAAAKKLKTPEATLAAFERLFRHIYPVLKEIEAPPNDPEQEIPKPPPAALSLPSASPQQIIGAVMALAATKDGSSS